MIEMRRGRIQAKLVDGDQQGGGVRTSGDRDQHTISRSDEHGSLDALDERLGGVCQKHGGAGWTRTSDNAIMSRALYHLSYGTAQAGRELGALEGEDPILRSVRAPSACASSPVAWPAPLSYTHLTLPTNAADPSKWPTNSEASP